MAAPLRLRNKHLCTSTERDPGFVTHKLSDYPPNMRLIAQDMLGLNEDGVFIRDVRHGSPAHKADLRAGDQIISINGKTVPSLKTQPRFYAALARNAFNAAQTKISILRAGGQIHSAVLRAQTACEMPISVVFSQNINAYTNGAEIFITSALMQSAPDDAVLSLLVAHEMAHIIAGHTEQVLSQTLEIEADSLALPLMVNAGLDIDRAVDMWASTHHVHEDSQAGSKTHPDIQARYENFRRVQASLQTVKPRLKLTRKPDYLPEP